MEPPAPPVNDHEGIPRAVEDAVPSLPSADGAAQVQGDGNGDGIADSQQPAVASTQFSLSTPGAAPSYITLVANSQDGKVNPAGSSTALTVVSQLDAPANLPAQFEQPLGLLSFSAQMPVQGAAEQFSLYIDPALGANGFWALNATSTWVNLASGPHGGQLVSEGGRMRLDFQVQDGGEFDTDGLANGVITLAGAAGALPLSLTGYVPDLPTDGLWL